MPVHIREEPKEAAFHAVQPSSAAAGEGELMLGTKMVVVAAGGG